MAISQPRYAIEKRLTLKRRDRIWAIFVVNFRLRTLRILPVVLIAIGMLLTVLPLLVTVLTYETLQFGSTVALAVFYQPYGGFLLFLFIMLLTALVGGGIVSDDLGTKAISLYLSRPITLADYLLAKGGVVAAAIGLIAVLPGLIAAVLAYVLGYVDGQIAAEALGIYVGLGILLTITFSSLALFLSSLTDRRSWAAAGIFAFLLLDTIVADILHVVSQNVTWLYVSPWEDLTSVARYLFGVPVTDPSPDPLTAFAILAVLIVLLCAATFVRLSRMELVTE